MKINLTHKEANLLAAILWDLTEERGVVVRADSDIWRISDSGGDICRAIADKLEEANDELRRKTGKDRDLSGSPKGTIQEARWSA